MLVPDDPRVPWGMGLVEGLGHLWVETGVLTRALAWRYKFADYGRGPADSGCAPVSPLTSAGLFPPGANRPLPTTGTWQPSRSSPYDASPSSAASTGARGSGRGASWWRPRAGRAAPSPASGTMPARRASRPTLPSSFLRSPALLSPSASFRPSSVSRRSSFSPSASSPCRPPSRGPLPRALPVSTPARRPPPPLPRGLAPPEFLLAVPAATECWMVTGADHLVLVDRVGLWSWGGGYRTRGAAPRQRRAPLGPPAWSRTRAAG